MMMTTYDSRAPISGLDPTATHSWCDKLGRLGAYLASRNVQHVSISDIEGGYLVLYSTIDGPAVETFTHVEVAALPRLDWTRSTNPLQYDLAAIGGYFDRNNAVSPLVVQQQGGYYLEYSVHRTRVSQCLNSDDLRRDDQGARAMQPA